LLTIEVDSWFLPDTAGVSYQTGHTKTTIVPQAIDVEAKRLGYFHNAGYHGLEGEDFDGVLRLGSASSVLPPYVELLKMDAIRRPDHRFLDDVLATAAAHLRRRPVDNPMVRFRKRLDVDVAVLAERDMEYFHSYAFGTCRQCGANAELAGSFVDWLGGHGEGGLGPVADRFRRISESTKALQFGLARAARGRAVDLDGTLHQMEQDWDEALGALAARYAG
jgi:hypothetical protein